MKNRKQHLKRSIPFIIQVYGNLNKTFETRLNQEVDTVQYACTCKLIIGMDIVLLQYQVTFTSSSNNVYLNSKTHNPNLWSFNLRFIKQEKQSYVLSVNSFK